MHQVFVFTNYCPINMTITNFVLGGNNPLSDGRKTVVIKCIIMLYSISKSLSHSDVSALSLHSIATQNYWRWGLVLGNAKINQHVGIFWRYLTLKFALPPTPTPVCFTYISCCLCIIFRVGYAKISGRKGGFQWNMGYLYIF